MCFLLLDGQVMPDEAPTARFTARERERERRARRNHVKSGLDSERRLCQCVVLL